MAMHSHNNNVGMLLFVFWHIYFAL